MVVMGGERRKMKGKRGQETFLRSTLWLWRKGEPPVPVKFDFESRWLVFEQSNVSWDVPAWDQGDEEASIKDLHVYFLAPREEYGCKTSLPLSPNPPGVDSHANSLSPSLSRV
jgi:hypothetical protein